MRLSLRVKFVVPVLALIVLGMSVSGVMSYFKAKALLKEIIYEGVENLSGSTAKILSSWVDDRKLDIKIRSQSNLYRAAVLKSTEGETARKETDKALLALKNENKYYEGLNIINSEGDIVSGSNPAIIGKINLSGRDYFRDAMGGKHVVSKIIISKATGNPVFVIASPLNGKSGVVNGVLMSIVDVNSFNEDFITPIKIGDTGYAYVYDEIGRFIAHPQKEMILKINIGKFDFGKEMIKLGSGLVEYEWGEDKIEKMVAFTKEPSLGWTVAVGANNEELMGPAKELGLISLIIGLIVSAIALVGVTILVHKMVQPINSIKDNLKDIAQGEGDLTQRLAVSSKDEVGEMGTWFNSFLDNMQSMIKDISSNAGSLTEASSGLSVISGQMSSDTATASEKTGNVSQSADEINSKINAVAVAMEQAATNLNMVAAATEQMTTNAGEMAKTSEKAQGTTSNAVSRSEKVLEKVNRLGDATQAISEVTDVITEISEQTNLLALNATIEAARAGEAGKGFAVVANEIKELARQTAEATLKINEQIEGVQASTSETVDEISEITSVIANVDDMVSTISKAVEEQSATTIEISDNIAQAYTGIQDVNNDVAESSSVMSSIARELEDVNRFNGEVANSSSQVDISAGELSGMAANINEMVLRFKV